MSYVAHCIGYRVHDVSFVRNNSFYQLILGFGIILGFVLDGVIIGIGIISGFVLDAVILSVVIILGLLPR
jgi:hypothetical protein